MSLSCREITPDEYDSVGNAGEKLLATLFPGSPAPSIAKRIAAGTVHPMLLGVDEDSALAAVLHLERDADAWRISASLGKGQKGGSPRAIALCCALWKRAADECRARGLRAYVVESAIDRAPPFAPAAFEHASAYAPLAEIGLVMGEPVRTIMRKIVGVRFRGARVAASPDWVDVDPDNLPAQIRRPARSSPDRTVTYRARENGGIVMVELEQAERDPRLVGWGTISHEAGPPVDALDATRDGLAILLQLGCAKAYAHDALAKGLVDSPTPDLELDPDDRMQWKWWCPA